MVTTSRLKAPRQLVVHDYLKTFTKFNICKIPRLFVIRKIIAKVIPKNELFNKIAEIFEILTIFRKLAQKIRLVQESFDRLTYIIVRLIEFLCTQQFMLMVNA